MMTPGTGTSNFSGFRFFVVLILACLISAIPLKTSYAETYTVTRLDDFNLYVNEHCLRTAIRSANNNAGIDIIVLPEGVHTLSQAGINENDCFTGDLDIRDDIVIQGAGAKDCIVDAGAIDRVFDIRSPASFVAISDITIKNGRVAEPDTSLSGAGIQIVHGEIQVVLARTIITGNMVVGSIDQATGGGLFNRGICSVYDTTISHNHAWRGGGVFNSTGTLKIYRSTINSNIAGQSGGGIITYGDLILENNTIYGNYSNDGAAGGIYLSSSSTADINFCTIFGNYAKSPSGGILNSSPDADINNSIVAGNCLLDGFTSANCYCSCDFLNSSANIDSTDSCGFSDTLNLNQTDPMLGPFKDNGGPTQTLAPLAGSPAIDNPLCTQIISVDQRNRKRPFGKYPDIGAVECYRVFIPPLLMLLQ